MIAKDCNFAFLDLISRLLEALNLFGDVGTEADGYAVYVERLRSGEKHLHGYKLGPLNDVDREAIAAGECVVNGRRCRIYNVREDSFCFREDYPDEISSSGE